MATTKYNATNQQIIAAFEAAGIGKVSNIEELSDGWFNRIYSAEDANGVKYVIKFAPPSDAVVLSYEKDLMAAEVKCYRALQKFTDIRTPQVYFSDFTHNVIPTPYFIMEFLPGVRLDKAKLNEQQQLEVRQKTAWILSEFHKIKGYGFGYEQTGLKASWQEALLGMTQNLIDDCAIFGKKCKLGVKLLKYISKCSSALEGVESVMVNFDLHSANMFCNFTDDGRVELAVLDLERYLYGDAIGDFVILEFNMPLADRKIIEFYNSYAKMPINGSINEEIRLNLMLAYLATIMYAERFSRFHSISKIFNSVFLAGTACYKFFGRLAFRRLSKLIKQL